MVTEVILLVPPGGMTVSPVAVSLGRAPNGTVEPSENCRVAEVIRSLKERVYVRSGDVVVLTLAIPIHSGESTNLLKIHKID